MKKKSGFTLVELLCVLVILAILVLVVGRTVTKSVNEAKKEITASQEKTILNATEKWTVDNSDKFDDIEGTSFQVGLDVVFVVDVSGSMKKDINTGNDTRAYQNTRMYATVEAINSSLEVLKTNKDNKVGFAFYSGRRLSRGWGGTSCSSSTGSGATPDCSIIKQLDLTNVENVGSLNMRSIDSFSLNGQSVDIEGGTYTLIGIQKAMNMFPTSTKSRIPVIILLTDGEPTWGSDMDENNPFSMKNSTIGSGGTDNLISSDNNKMVWSIMRTAYLAKERLRNNYQAESFFYTIGLGVTSNYGEFMLNPAKGTSKLKNGTNLDKSLYNYMTKVKQDYVYPTAAFTGNMSAEELKKIFIDIATEITKATEVTTLCVSVDELKDGGYLSKDAKIDDTLAQNTYVIVSENAATNQYGFSMLKRSNYADGDDGEAEYQKQVNACKTMVEERKNNE